jgi:hypothetical protein
MAMVTGTGPVRSTNPCTVSGPLASEKVPRTVGEGRRRAVRVRPWPVQQGHTPVPDQQIEALKVRYDLKLLGE